MVPGVWDLMAQPSWLPMRRTDPRVAEAALRPAHPYSERRPPGQPAKVLPVGLVSATLRPLIPSLEAVVVVRVLQVVPAQRLLAAPGEPALRIRSPELRLFMEAVVAEVRDQQAMLVGADKGVAELGVLIPQELPAQRIPEEEGGVLDP